MILLKNKFFITILFYIFLIGIAFSEDVRINKIIINGNKNVSKETILSIGGIKENSTIRIDNLNIIQKKIYESNFFSKININIVDNSLILNLEENPTIDYIVIQGLDHNEKYLNQLEKITLLKTNSFYTVSGLNKDIINIKNFLSSNGYLNNEVIFQVKQIESNKVNIFIDVKLNNQFSIKNIFFIGDKNFSSSKLINIVESKQDSWFSFFSSASIPSTQKLNYDVSLLKNFYLTQGFYDVQINDASINIIDNKFVDVVFSINSGDKYMLDNYLISNNLNFLKSDQILDLNKIIKKYINKVYNINKIKELSDSLTNFLLNLDIVSNVSYKISKASEKKLLITLEINEVNNNQIIKNINISGNDLTEERVIRNSLQFAEGDIFLENRLKKSEDYIKSLGIFKNVEIKKITKDPNNIDLDISVVEMPTGEVSTGFGIGSTGASINFNLKENNFLGKGISTNVNANIGTNQIIGSFTYQDPDFANTGNNLKNSFFVVKNNYTNIGYENKIIGDTISTRYEFLTDIYLESGFSLTNDSISINEGASALVATQKGDYLTTKFFYGFTQDKRNSRFMPTSGYQTNFGQEFSTPPSDIPSLSNNLSGSNYFLFTENFIGTVKYRIKTINSLDGKPVKLSDRLYNYQDELRGFGYRSIGPKVSGDYIGGNYLYTTTFATTIPNGIPDTWKATSSIFLDIGNIWGSDISGVPDSNLIRASFGAGLTWLSPIGPVSMTYALPIKKDTNDEVKNFSFNIGSAF